MLLNPLPLSQTVTPSRTPTLLERDVLYGRPHRGMILERSLQSTCMHFSLQEPAG